MGSADTSPFAQLSLLSWLPSMSVAHTLLAVSCSPAICEIWSGSGLDRESWTGAVLCGSRVGQARAVCGRMHPTGIMCGVRSNLWLVACMCAVLAAVKGKCCLLRQAAAVVALRSRCWETRTCLFCGQKGGVLFVCLLLVSDAPTVGTRVFGTHRGFGSSESCMILL